MFTTALFVVGPNWEQLKCPSTDEWISKLWCSHTMEYYLAIKRNELSIHSTWMHLKIIMLII